MVLVCRGLALACSDVPALPVVLVVFLAPGVPSLCLVAVVVVVVPPAALAVVATAVLCCFLTGASRGPTCFVRAGGLVTDLSEQFRKRKVKRRESVQILYNYKQREARKEEHTVMKRWTCMQARTDCGKQS